MRPNTNRPKRRPRLHLGRSAIVGLRLGAFFVGLSAAILLAVIGWNTYRARTGAPGGEAMILPAFATCIYIGWAFRGDMDAWRRGKEGEHESTAGHRGTARGGQT